MNEWSRQGFHIFAVLLMVLWAALMPPYWFALLGAVLLLLGGLLVTVKNPLLGHLINWFERDHNKAVFPGKGAFAIVLGATLTALIFPASLIPALLVLAIPDSFSTLVGKLSGKRKLPWSPRKSWLGTFAFLLSCAVVLYFYTSLWYVGALVLTFFETIDYNDILLLDDNLLLPLVTGALLVII